MPKYDIGAAACLSALFITFQAFQLEGVLQLFENDVLH